MNCWTAPRCGNWSNARTATPSSPASGGSWTICATRFRSAAAEIKVPHPSELAERIAQWIVDRGDATNLRPVINATGSCCTPGWAAPRWRNRRWQAIADVARGYASLEVDVSTGERSQRMRDAEAWLKRITGAEAAAVVNNNAGATLLTLSALARGREVIVSRGQLVEIGGSYRLAGSDGIERREAARSGDDEQDADRRLSSGDRP